MEKHLGIHMGETTKDGLFTMQEVECLGACVNAPMLQINNEWVYEDLTPENVIPLLENLKKGTAKKGPQTERKNSVGIMGRTSLTDETVMVDEVRYTRDFAKAKAEWEEEINQAKK
jgi:NADH dehydrogenase (ubiquinone) flavoprotein 2